MQPHAGRLEKSQKGLWAHPSGKRDQEVMPEIVVEVQANLPRATAATPAADLAASFRQPPSQSGDICAKLDAPLDALTLLQCEPPSSAQLPPCDAVCATGGADLGLPPAPCGVPLGPSLHSLAVAHGPASQWPQRGTAVCSAPAALHEERWTRMLPVSSVR